MKTFYSFGILFLAIQFLSGQTVDSNQENNILRVADSIADGEFSGAIVIDNKFGQKKIFTHGMAHEKMEQSIEENQLFNLLSLGKSLTAAVVVKLAQEGKLDLKDTIHEYLPNRNIPNQDRITIRQLLSHTSGLGDYMTAEEYESLPKSKADLDQLLSIIEKQPVREEPGASFVYSNSGYIVLGAIIEAIEKETYEKVLREKVLNPAGIEKVRLSGGENEVRYYSTQSRQPINEDFPPASSDGGIWMNAKDLSKFLNFLLSDAYTEESHALLFNRVLHFPDRGERKNGGLASSFLVYEYPGEVKVIGNNGGYKGSTYSAFRILYNQKGEKVFAIVLSNKEDTAGPAIRALEEEIKNALQ